MPVRQRALNRKQEKRPLQLLAALDHFLPLGAHSSGAREVERVQFAQDRLEQLVGGEDVGHRRLWQSQVSHEIAFSLVKLL